MAANYRCITDYRRNPNNLFHGHCYLCYFPEKDFRSIYCRTCLLWCHKNFHYPCYWYSYQSCYFPPYSPCCCFAFISYYSSCRYSCRFRSHRCLYRHHTIASIFYHPGDNFPSACCYYCSGCWCLFLHLDNKNWCHLVDNFRCYRRHHSLIFCSHYFGYHDNYYFKGACYQCTHYCSGDDTLLHCCCSAHNDWFGSWSCSQLLHHHCLWCLLLLVKRHFGLWNSVQRFLLLLHSAEVMFDHRSDLAAIRHHCYY